MRKVLVSWIGKTDLRAPAEMETVGLGPVAQALEARPYDEAILLNNYPETEVAPYLKWLRGRVGTPIRCEQKKLSGPTEFGEIYGAVVDVLTGLTARTRGEIDLVFHLSPGTPAMAAVWIILAKTRFPAELIESSKAAGVRTASIPFDISAEFIPDLLRRPDERLEKLSAGLPPEAPEFADILHRGAAMRTVIAKARRVAPRSVPVLIEGESGTGKELLARAIHRSSPRRDKPFVPVNCGAIPKELVESELFGHTKGAFTGATQVRQGLFVEADGGTLFLDEIGELPLNMQVKLLRVLQDQQIVLVGGHQPRKVDVRIITATNRVLTDEVAASRFRPDLFYRLAVAVLKLPPLRERSGDLGLLIDGLLDQVNRESREEPGYVQKKLSVTARNVLLAHPWPGNVRELLNTLRRAAVWSSGQVIPEVDAREAIIGLPEAASARILDRPLGDGFKLEDVMAEVARHYLARAMEQAHGNKTKAAKLVGLGSYQSLTNWLTKYRLGD